MGVIEAPARSVAKITVCPLVERMAQIEPMAMPLLHNGMMTSTMARQAPQPASVAASIRRRSMRTMVLKIGATMNGV